VDALEPLGRHHATIRRLRALRRDAGLRRSERVFIAEGFRLADEALSAGAPVEFALIAPRALSDEAGRELVGRLERRGVEIRATSEAVMDGLQDARSPRPLLLCVSMPVHEVEQVLDAGDEPALLVVPCGVQDPGNVGTLLRSTEAAWGTGLVALGGGADLFHPRAVRASAGSIFRLPACAAETDELLGALRRRGVRCLATGGAEGVDPTKADLRGPVALFLGSEGGGIDAAIRRRLDGALSVRLRPGVESLSVAAAAAVILFEAARQRGKRGD
jgi:TrmH family RNA methyltransferase